MLEFIFLLSVTLSTGEVHSTPMQSLFQCHVHKALKAQKGVLNVCTVLKVPVPVKT